MEATMSSTLFTIITGIISAAIYDYLKKHLALKQENESTMKYSKEYVHKVKIEFYVSFFIGIALTFFHPTGKFLPFVISTLSYMSFFISLMGFMCLVDVVNHFLNGDSNK
jgi:hypothetical protein